MTQEPGSLKDYEQSFIGIAELVRGFHIKLKNISTDIRDARKKNITTDDLRAKRTEITKLHSRCMVIKSKMTLENFQSYSSELLSLLDKYRQL